MIALLVALLLVIVLGTRAASGVVFAVAARAFVVVRLYRYANLPKPAAPAAITTFTITPHEDLVRLTDVREDLDSDSDRETALLGWSAVGANLKSLLETGSVLPQAPWDMHAELRTAQMARHDQH